MIIVLNIKIDIKNFIILIIILILSEYKTFNIYFHIYFL